MRIRNTAAMNVLGKLLLLFVSFVFSVLAAELLARVVFDPVDYLNPTLVADKFLNHRIEGYTGGHDEWGFRNARRSETADIVCIGDSMTYGMTARAHESWPAVLAEMRGGSFYNMGLGGYGQIKYLHLIKPLAVRLRPKTVFSGSILKMIFLTSTTWFVLMRTGVHTQSSKDKRSREAHSSSPANRVSSWGSCEIGCRRIACFMPL